MHNSFQKPQYSKVAFWFVILKWLFIIFMQHRYRCRNAARPPSSVSRRLNLDTPVGRRYFTGSRFYSDSNYNAEDVINSSAVWRPGQTIPIHTPTNTTAFNNTFEPANVQEEEEFDLRSMFQSMQHAIENKFDEVKESYCCWNLVYQMYRYTEPDWPSWQW